jgi:hypothetical protein
VVVHRPIVEHVADRSEDGDLRYSYFQTIRAREVAAGSDSWTQRVRVSFNIAVVLQWGAAFRGCLNFAACQVVKVRRSLRSSKDKGSWVATENSSIHVNKFTESCLRYRPKGWTVRRNQ